MGIGMAEAITIKGLDERIKELGELSTKNPMMHRRINEAIKQTLGAVRKSLQGQAQSGLRMDSDPRKAYKAVRMAVYRRIFGGNVNILQSRRASGMRLYEPPRKLREGQRGGNRIKRESGGRTEQLMSYQGKDRGFILRFLNQGTDERRSRYGKRGAIETRDWFGDASQQQLERAAENIDKIIDDIIQGIIF